jgi:galactose-1-phosphate uridylyltransferase
MKYLRKIFENSKIEALIDAVEEYNKVLKQDNIWKNYLNNIKDIKSLSIEELEEVLKFAEDRWEEIKKEFTNYEKVKIILMFKNYLGDFKIDFLKYIRNSIF